MMGGYWYMSGAEGMRFCWAKHPTFICPRSKSLWDFTDISTGETKVVEREPGERMGFTFTRHVATDVKQAAELLGMSPDLLEGAIRRIHSVSSGRLRVNGKLTDQCKACGHKLERLGFRCWIERDATEEERSTGDRITEAMGGTPTRTIKSLYMDTKKEAQRWARDEAKISKAVNV